MSKVKIWRYYIPPVNGEGWGLFIIDSTGFFSCVTDYGNYAYQWGHHGSEDFREFLLNIRQDGHNDYFLEKLSQGHIGNNEYKSQKTIKEIRSRILEGRREGRWSKARARKEYDLFKEHLNLHGFYSEFDFGTWYQETSIDDASELANYGFSASVKALGNKLLPRLAEVIRKELIEEGILKAS